jgi:catechol 2,3-dioxygenase-like lactoylglutathione lyase family enzyme
MKLLRCFVVVLFFAIPCSAAELPQCYQSMHRVTWIVRNVDQVSAAWKALGLTDIEESPHIQFTGKYRGKPATIRAREVTGKLGDLTIDFIQPEAAQTNAFTSFVSRHGDGIFSLVFEVSSKEEMDKEIQRMSSLGVNVLQQVTVRANGTPVTLTYFDTESQGKYVLGLVYRPGAATASRGKSTFSHLGAVVRDIPPVSAYWQRLGFQPIPIEHATPRKDMRYRGKPLWFYFDVGFQRFNPQFAVEWISAPATPANIYADYLKLHGEGIQHIGIPVDDLSSTVATYGKLGYSVWQAGAWGDVGKKDSGQYDYMDTDSIGGISVELIHAY